MDNSFPFLFLLFRFISVGGIVPTFAFHVSHAFISLQCRFFPFHSPAPSHFFYVFSFFISSSLSVHQTLWEEKMLMERADDSGAKKNWLLPWQTERCCLFIRQFYASLVHQWFTNQRRPSRPATPIRALKRVGEWKKRHVYLIAVSLLSCRTHRAPTRLI